MEPIGPFIIGVRTVSVFLARSQWALGLCLGCALSPILFVIFVDRISRSLQYGHQRIVSFVEFVAEYEVVGIRPWYSAGKRWIAPFRLGVSAAPRQLHRGEGAESKGEVNLNSHPRLC